MGAYFTCAIASGVAYCWGYGSNGQLGIGIQASSSVPMSVLSAGALQGKTFTHIEAGSNHACGIASGTAFCWGYNQSGQLGNNTSSSTSTPVAVATTGALAGKVVTALSVGGNQSCAIASGAAYCWGSNASGELGDGTKANSYIPVAVDVKLVKTGSTYEITAGYAHVCALTAGTANCWGSNGNGQLGNSTFENSNVPTSVTTKGVLDGKSVTAISNFSQNTCVVANGAAYCWGEGSVGQLGNGGYQNFTTPVAVSTSGVLAGKTVTAISVGYRYACAIANGDVYCWGYNFQGQLGNSSKISSAVPVAVTKSDALAGKSVTSLIASYSHTCAIASGSVYCWGSNESGQLGIQVAKDFFGEYVQTIFTSPVAVDTSGILKGRTVSSFVSPGSVLSGEKLIIWGGESRLPIESTWLNSGDLYSKVISSISGYVGTQSGQGCALSDKTIYCFGQVSPVRSSTPLKLPTTTAIGEKPVSFIASNSQSACAIAIGSLYCWGQNENGQLGNHSVANSATPVAVDTSETLKDREVVSVVFGNNVVYVLHRAMTAEAKAAAEKAAADELAKTKAAAEKALADAAAAAKAKLEAEAKAKVDADTAAKAKLAAEAKAAADAKASAEALAKAKLEAEARAVAAAKAKAEAEAKASTDAKAAAEAAARAKLEAEARARSEAESALVKAIAELKQATQTIAKLNDSNAELNRIIQALSDSNKNQQNQIDALNARITALLVPKPTTIVCAKGTTLKTVKGIDPVCPAGYKKK